MNILNTTVASLSLLTPLAGALPASYSTPVVVAEPAQPISGAKIQSVDWDNKSFRVMAEGKEEAQTVYWGDATEFMLDGAKSTAKEVLKTDGKVSVTFDEYGDAASVSRVTK